MTKKNQQPATSETAENPAMTEAAKNKILEIENRNDWIKFFKETAVKLAFKAKGSTENETLLFYGRFFRAFIEKFADLDETNENELGAQLASRLIEISRTDKERNGLQKRLQGLNGKIKQFTEEAKKNPEKAQHIAQAIGKLKQEAHEIEQYLQQF